MRNFHFALFSEQPPMSMDYKTLEFGIDRIDVFLTARNRECPIGYIVIFESSDKKSTMSNATRG